MYRGKFDEKRRSGDAAKVREAAHQRVTEPKKAAPAPATPAPVAEKTPEPYTNTQVTAPAAEAPAQDKPRRKGPRVGSVIFYSLYFIFIAVFCVAVFVGKNYLNNWLVDFQAGQPTTKCEEVFRQNFADPDWAALYTKIGAEDTQYEGVDAFVAYMDAKVGDTQLTYMETSAGLSGDKKYFIDMGDEHIGYFTLVSMGENAEGIPSWDLGEIVLYYQRTESVTVRMMAGYTAYVNGIALDDSHTIATTYTVAESYLPDDVLGLRLNTQAVEGFLIEPEVTVFDADGNPITVTYDAENDIYVAEIPASPTNTISEEEEARVIGAAETYALYMIEKATQGELLGYFDRDSNVFRSIYGMDMWMQNCNNYELKDQTVSGYYRYTDTLFSARVSLTLSVTRTNGTVKDYNVDTTLFFELQDGKWMCIEMTNKDVQEQISEVRITFMQDETNLSSRFYATDVTQISGPVMTAPEGQVFAGWFVKGVNASGHTTWTKVFDADANGVITVPNSMTLEPMTLYALFEDAPETEGETE